MNFKELIIKIREEIIGLNSEDSLKIQDKLLGLEKVERYMNDPGSFVKEHSQNIKYCMASNISTCGGNIIQAHSTSKKHLRNIADKRHILTVEHLPKGRELKRKGVGGAGRFPCFCTSHDNVLFKSFEEHDFDGSYEQIYDCTFRALCTQYFPLQIFKDFPIFLDEMLERCFGSNFSSCQGYSSILVPEQMRDHGFLYDEYQKLKNNGLSYIVLETSRLPIAASGVFFPSSDLNGNVIESLAGRRHGFVYYVLTEKTMSYIVLATIKSHCGIEKSILGQFNNLDIKILDYLLSVLLQNNDSFYISPQWFELLDPTFKKSLSEELCRPIHLAGGRAITIFRDISHHAGIGSHKIKACNI